MGNKPYTLIDTFERIHSLVKRWVTEVADCDLAGTYDSGSDRVENIENKHVSGFIPFTDGGVEAVIPALLDYCDGSGTAPDVIQPFIEQAHEDAETEWNESHPEHTTDWIFADARQLDLEGSEASQRERDHWREKYWEHERAFLEGTFFYKVRAIYHARTNSRNESGKDEVLFCVGVNTDFEYGCDTIPWLSCYGGKPQQTDWVWECHVAANDVSEDLIEKLIADATAALEAA